MLTNPLTSVKILGGGDENPVEDTAVVTMASLAAVAVVLIVVVSLNITLILWLKWRANSKWRTILSRPSDGPRSSTNPYLYT